MEKLLKSSLNPNLMLHLYINKDSEKKKGAGRGSSDSCRYMGDSYSSRVDTVWLEAHSFREVEKVTHLHRPFHFIMFTGQLLPLAFGLTAAGHTKGGKHSEVVKKSSSLEMFCERLRACKASIHHCLSPCVVRPTPPKSSGMNH